MGWSPEVVVMIFHDVQVTLALASRDYKKAEAVFTLHNGGYING